jgi:hypothetical protein
MKTVLLFVLSVTASLCSFAQTENFWTVKSDFAGLKRERSVAFTIDNLAYVGMGVDTAEVTKNDLWSYDPLTDSWTQKANLPGVARRNAIAFTINGKGYVGTGYSQAESILGVELSDFWEYNPTTNSWTQRASYPVAIYFATGFAIGNKGYVCGGKTGPNFYTAQMYQYDPVTNQWTPRAPFPGGVRYQLASFVIENSGYVGLGTDQDMYRKDWYEYKPSLDQWIQRADLPASERGSTHDFAIGSRGFICMGTNGGYLDDLWEYNPANDTWYVRATYGGSKRKNGVAFALYGKGFVGTGKGYDGKKASMYEYTPGAWVGLSEQNLEAIQIYPNPAENEIHLQSTSDEIDRVEICSLTGQVVFTSEFVNTLYLGDFAAGSYLLLAKNKQGEIIGNEKLIIR